MAAAGLEAGAGEFEYVIEELLRHRQKAGVYEFLVAWAGYEDQTWEISENLPKVVVDDYWACLEGPEESSDDPDDPPDRGLSTGIISDEDLMKSLIQDRVQDLHNVMFQAAMVLGLQKKSGESRQRLKRRNAKIAKVGSTRARIERQLLAAKVAKHVNFKLNCAPSTWRSLEAVAGDGDADVTQMAFRSAEDLHAAVGDVGWAFQRNAHTEQRGMLPMAQVLVSVHDVGVGTRAAVLSLTLDQATILPTSTQVSIQVPLESIVIDEPILFTYKDGLVKVKGPIYHAESIAADAAKLTMPLISELTEDINVWRECPILGCNSREMVV